MSYERFPQCIYHPAHDPITVKNEIELQTYLSQGWSITPISQTPEGMIRAKIAWHQAEIERLQDALESILAENEGQDSDGGNTAQELAVHGSTDTKSKRGRPRKS